MSYILALASALCLILTFPRFNIALLAPAALTPLLYALAREKHPARRFFCGYIAGVAYWFGVCYWIQFVLSFHGGMGEIAAWGAFLLFCLIKALHMGVFGLLAGALIQSSWAVPAVAALWVAIEFTHGFLGFAWLALGNAGAEMGIPMRLAPYTGVYGLSFVFMMMATGLALALLRRPRTHLLWLLLLPFLIFLPRLPDPQRGRATAILVQPNISETEQWTPESVDKMQRSLVMLSMQAHMQGRGDPASILVWPEVPGPLYYYEDPRLRQYLETLARVTRAWVLAGIVAHTQHGEPLNSALLLSPAGQAVSRYDKVNLVPFGEFVPWPFDFVRKISTEAGDFAPGREVVVSAMGDHRIGTFICYESVFPDFVRRFAAQGAEVLFNISNDGWFGKSAAREQHLRIVRMRAAENRRWILRATNNGVTAAIDPAGRVRGTLPSYVQAASRSGFTFIGEQTFYTRHGDWFVFFCAAFTLPALIRAGLPGHRRP